jgi:hypothetical protein
MDAVEPNWAKHRPFALDSAPLTLTQTIPVDSPSAAWPRR